MTTSQPAVKKHRDMAMDILKCFAIILVLWGHAIQHLTGRYADGSFNLVYAFIYSFHMPLFMIISGYFAKSSGDGTSFSEILKSRARQLLVPAIFGTVMLWVWIWCSGETFDPHFYTTGVLWFLKSLFMCAVFYYVCTMFKRRNLALIIGLILSQTVTICNFCYMYPSFLLGAVLRHHMPFMRRHRLLIMTICGGLFAYLFYILDSTFIYSPNLVEAVSGAVDGDYSVAYELAWKRAYRIFIGINGSLFFIMLFDFAATSMMRGAIGKGMAKIGSMTLAIYFLQTFILEIFMRHIITFDAQPEWLYSFVYTPLISVGVLVLCIFIIKIVEHSRIGRILILGKSGTR